MKVNAVCLQAEASKLRATNKASNMLVENITVQAAILFYVAEIVPIYFSACLRLLLMFPVP
jgi:hypothetical protein